MIIVTCPHCSARFKNARNLAGASFTCPTCNRRFRVAAMDSPLGGATGNASPPEATSNWYCRFGDRVIGPLTSTQMLEMARAGQLRQGDLVSAGETGKWTSVGQIEWLRSAIAPPEQPTSVPDSRPSPAPEANRGSVTERQRPAEPPAMRTPPPSPIDQSDRKQVPGKAGTRPDAAPSSTINSSSHSVGGDAANVVACPHCSQHFVNSPNLAGMVVACTSCGREFQMPQATPQPSSRHSVGDEAASILACPHCSQHFASTPGLAGKVVPCPSCGRQFQVSQATPQPQSSHSVGGDAADGCPSIPQIKSAPEAPPSAGGWSGPAWLLGGIVLGSLVVLTCGGLFLLLVVIGASEPGESGPTASAPPVSAPSDPPPPTREQIVAQQTYEYWCGLTQIIRSVLPSDTRPDAQTMAALFRQAVAKIRALPTSDVDQDAVQCGIDAATVFANLAGYIDHENDPARLVEAFLRGAAGDPFGPAADSLSTHSALGQQLQQIAIEFDNARAILSSRYGVEFPSI